MGTVMITGASSGIGKALATTFGTEGHDLVLVARTKSKLQQLATELRAATGVQVSIEIADLSKRGAVKKLFSSVSDSNLDIDILVNCAGVLEHGRFVRMSPRLHKNLIDLNISGLTEMLTHFLPPMTERGRGRVLNVASIAAFQPVPSLATYAATKAYVLSLTESLAEELAGTGVSMTALCPGITATNMMNKARAGSTGLRIPNFAIGDADTVAKEAYKACMKGTVICVPGVMNRASTISGRAMPKWLLRRLSGVMGRFTLDKD